MTKYLARNSLANKRNIIAKPKEVIKGTVHSTKVLTTNPKMLTVPKRYEIIGQTNN
jgi:hypothetical protein